MADQQLNMRVPEEVAERFRAFCKEQGISQPQGMDSLLAMMELVQSKEALPNRQTEIESFEMHIKAVLDGYIRSLEINAEAEERIKAQFISSLDSKDKSIMALQEKNEKMAALLTEAEEKQREAEKKALEAVKEATAAVEMAKSAERTAADKAAIVEMLQGQVKEAEKKLGDLEVVQQENKAAKETIAKLEDKVKEAEFKIQRAAMEAELKSSKEIAAIKEAAAQEKADMERKHSEEIKALYEKMSGYQEQLMKKPTPDSKEESGNDK